MKHFAHGLWSLGAQVVDDVGRYARRFWELPGRAIGLTELRSVTLSDSLGEALQDSVTFETHRGLEVVQTGGGIFGQLAASERMPAFLPRERTYQVGRDGVTRIELSTLGVEVYIDSGEVRGYPSEYVLRWSRYA